MEQIFPIFSWTTILELYNLDWTVHISICMLWEVIEWELFTFSAVLVCVCVGVWVGLCFMYNEYRTLLDGVTWCMSGLYPSTGPHLFRTVTIQVHKDGNWSHLHGVQVAGMQVAGMYVVLW